MLEYLEKLKKLPEETRAKISAVKTTQMIGILEEKYSVKLATLVIRLAIQDVALGNLKNILVNELGLDNERATHLEKELREKVLITIWDHLEPSSLRIEVGKVLSEEEDVDEIVSKPVSDKKEMRSDMVKRSLQRPAKKQFLPKNDTKVLPKEMGLDHLLPKSKNKPAVADFSKPRKRNITPVKPVLKEEDISFFDEDKKEVEEMVKQIPKPKEQEAQKKETSGKIEGIIKAVKISFSSGILSNRFKQIVATYLLGVRNKVATKEIMMRTVENGGLGLTDIISSKVMNIVVKEKGEKVEDENINIKTTKNGSNFIFNRKETGDRLRMEEKGKSVPKENPGTPDGDYNLASALKEKRLASMVTETIKKPEMAKTLTPNKVKPLAPLEKIGKENIVKKTPSPSGRFTKDSVLGTSLDVPKEKEEKSEVRRNGVSTGKKKMDDIKTPNVMSPVDELAYMDLVAFRRMGDDPKKRVDKIQGKIDLLGKEGIDKLIAGVKAWRKSPVNKTYLQIGEESINEGKSMDDIIKIRKEKGLNYLERNELDAVMDLNHQLKF